MTSLPGIELIEVGERYSIAKMEIQEKHLNAANIVQGGVIFTLADFASVTDENDNLVVQFNGSVYRKNEMHGF